MPSDTPQEGAGSGADTLMSLSGVPYIGSIDARTKAARLFKAALVALIADRGGVQAMSNAELLLVRRAAGAGVLCDTIESKIVAGEDIKADMVNAYLAASNDFRRLVTTLGLRKPGDVVNLEVDVLAKYVKRLLEARK